MTTKRVQNAAAARGVFFDGKATPNGWTRYQVFSPSGCGFLQSDTLDGLYRLLQRYPIIRR